MVPATVVAPSVPVASAMPRSREESFAA
jgi:hypothetical protein